MSTKKPKARIYIIAASWGLVTLAAVAGTQAFRATKTKPGAVKTAAATPEEITAQDAIAKELRKAFGATDYEIMGGTGGDPFVVKFRRDFPTDYASRLKGYLERSVIKATGAVRQVEIIQNVVISKAGVEKAKGQAQAKKAGGTASFGAFGGFPSGRTGALATFILLASTLVLVWRFLAAAVRDASTNKSKSVYAPQPKDEVVAFSAAAEAAVVERAAVEETLAIAAKNEGDAEVVGEEVIEALITSKPAFAQIEITIEAEEIFAQDKETATAETLVSTDVNPAQPIEPEMSAKIEAQTSASALGNAQPARKSFSFFKFGSSKSKNSEPPVAVEEKASPIAQIIDLEGPAIVAPKHEQYERALKKSQREFTALKTEMEGVTYLWQQSADELFALQHRFAKEVSEKNAMRGKIKALSSEIAFLTERQERLMAMMMYREGRSGERPAAATASGSKVSDFLRDRPDEAKFEGDAAADPRARAQRPAATDDKNEFFV